ncbi:MAG: nickel pincer cofactor biosynthesis protein LarB [Deltaproteobacteria bacterium]|nr:nickel pincer cofactor biosynthesis protein LarB [Deltaproteobacteria bacterium]
MDRIAYLDDLARLDLDRQARAGIPEAIYGEGKTLDQVLQIATRLATECGRAIVTRLLPGWLEELRARLEPQLSVEGYGGRVAVVRRPGHRPAPSGGLIGLLAAGTSDIPVAEEARVAAEEMGCAVIHHYDVGVAGVHRLVEPLRELLARDVAAVVAVAGMEGALPTFVRGLVPCPVIGVPTSVGYGHGGRGEGALTTMLQSCAPGLTVVNIDNGFGAGATAALYANQLARAARRASTEGAP